MWTLSLLGVNESFSRAEIRHERRERFIYEQSLDVQNFLPFQAPTSVK